MTNYTFDIILIVLVIIVILCIYNIVIHTNINARLNQHVRVSYANLKVAINNRLRLVSQLNDVVKLYIGHEAAILSNVGHMSNLYMMYPNLQGNHLVQKLMSQINDAETTILFSKKEYNEVVAEYNTHLQCIAGALFTIGPRYEFQYAN